MPNIIEITDFSAPALDAYARLTERELRSCCHPDEGLFIAESPNVILRALDAGFEPVSLLMERRHIVNQAAAVIARCPGVPVYTAELPVLTQLTGFALTRGVLCAMRRRPIPPAQALLDRAHCVAVLENIMNPTNLGAIFRSAAALGVDAVLLTPGSCDPLYRRAVRVSMGTVFQIPWAWLGQASGDWPEAGLRVLRNCGYQTAAMALSDTAISIADPVLARAGKLAVVLGTEGDGLSPQTIARCDYTVKIPMYHGVDSLNVAAASAVAFYQLVSGRNAESVANDQ